MIEWTINLEFGNERDGELRLRGATPVSAISVDGGAVNFDLPAGGHAYLTSTGSTDFAKPPTESPFPVELYETYVLTAGVSLSGGQAAFWVIEYDQTRRLCHRSRVLRNGRFELVWHSHPRHRTCCAAIRLSGRGRLRVSDLRVSRLVGECDAGVGDACVRAPAVGDELVGELERARIGRVLLTSAGGDPWLGAFDQFARLGAEHPGKFYPILRYRRPASDSSAFREFADNQLEVLWQMSRLAGIEFVPHEDDQPRQSVLDWAERRQVLTMWSVRAESDVRRLEQDVLSKYTFPVLLSWASEAESPGSVQAAALDACHRHRQLHLLTSAAWRGNALVDAIGRRPRQVLMASNCPISEASAAREAVLELADNDETRACVVSTNLWKLTERVDRQRADLLAAADDLRFPPLPHTPAETRAQGFELIAPDEMPAGEVEDAKEHWAGDGVRTFYRDTKPWADEIVQLTHDLGARSVLEFGCNIGRNLHAIAEKLPDVRLVGVDINREAVELGREHTGLDLRYGDERALAEFDAGEFDLVFTVSVLDHIPDIREVCRLLTRCAAKCVYLLEVTLPIEGKVVRHFDHKRGGVRDSTGASYSWDVARFLKDDPRIRRLDIRPRYLHPASLGPYYWSYLGFVGPTVCDKPR